jgi:cytoskeletal protein RodZ
LFTSGGGLLVAVALLLVIFALSWIVRMVLQATRIPEHASPTTTAALRAEGIANPDEYLSEIVDEFTEPTDADSSEDRTASVQEDPAQAAAEHKDAMTPTSGRSKAVGP